GVVEGVGQGVGALAQSLHGGVGVVDGVAVGAVGVERQRAEVARQRAAEGARGRPVCIGRDHQGRVFSVAVGDGIGDDVAGPIGAAAVVETAGFGGGGGLGIG